MMAAAERSRGPGPSPGPGPGSSGPAAADYSVLVVVGVLRVSGQLERLLQQIDSGVRRWCVDLDASVVDQQLKLFVSRHSAFMSQDVPGQRTLRHHGDVLDTQVLVNPVQDFVVSEVRRLLCEPSRHKLLVVAGQCVEDSADVLLQTGSFSLGLLLHILGEDQVSELLSSSQVKPGLTLCCPDRGEWTRSLLDPPRLRDLMRIRINPAPALPEMEGLQEFTEYLSECLEPDSPFQLLEPPGTVGFLKLSRPCCYVFPGGRGDSAFFAVNGFNVLVNGGADPRSCFWKLVRHLDRIDSVLLTHVGVDNLPGLNSLLLRKVREREDGSGSGSGAEDDWTKNLLSPEIGVVFLNVPDRVRSVREDPGELRSCHQAALTLEYLERLSIRPQPLCRSNGPVLEPLILFQKMGVGRLELYVLSPVHGSRDLETFTQLWPQEGSKVKGPGLPLTCLVSMCVLLVWHPFGPLEKTVRVLFPGCSPQNRILEALEKLKHLDFLKHPSGPSDAQAPKSQRAAGRAESRESLKSGSREVRTARDKTGRVDLKRQEVKTKSKAAGEAAPLRDKTDGDLKGKLLRAEKSPRKEEKEGKEVKDEKEVKEVKKEEKKEVKEVKEVKKEVKEVKKEEKKEVKEVKPRDDRVSKKEEERRKEVMKPKKVDPKSRDTRTEQKKTSSKPVLKDPRKTGSGIPSAAGSDVRKSSGKMVKRDGTVPNKGSRTKPESGPKDGDVSKGAESDGRRAANGPVSNGTRTSKSPNKDPPTKRPETPTSAAAPQGGAPDRGTAPRDGPAPSPAAAPGWAERAAPPGDRDGLNGHGDELDWDSGAPLRSSLHGGSEETEPGSDVPHDVDLCLVTPCEFKHPRTSQNQIGQEPDDNNNQDQPPPPALSLETPPFSQETPPFSPETPPTSTSHSLSSALTDSDVPLASEDRPSVSSDSERERADPSPGEPGGSPSVRRAAPSPDPPPAPVKDLPPLPPQPGACMADAEAEASARSLKSSKLKKPSGSAQRPAPAGSAPPNGRSKVGISSGSLKTASGPEAKPSSRVSPGGSRLGTLKPPSSAPRVSEGSAVYVDLAYLPSGAASSTVDVDFFRRVRATYYIISGNDPAKQEVMRRILDALLEGKSGWPELQVTLIPTFDSLAMHEWYQETHERQKELSVTVLGSNSTVAMQEETFPACKVEF